MIRPFRVLAEYWGPSLCPLRKYNGPNPAGTPQGCAGSDRLSFMFSSLAHPCLLPLSREGWSLSARPLLSPHQHHPQAMPLPTRKPAQPKGEPGPQDILAPDF